MTSSGPVLFLDVDGVLNPFDSKGPHKHWPDYLKHTVRHPNRPYRMWFSRSLGRMLAEICAEHGIEIVWATSWAVHIEDLIVPLANIPAGLVVLGYPDAADEDRRNTGKVNEVAAYAGDRPAIWIDDCLGPADRAWAEERDAPTLLIRPRPSVGLRYADLATIEAFTAEL